MKSLLHNDWQTILAPNFATEEFNSLATFLQIEREKYNIFPPKAEVFNAFNLTDFEKTRVVILGQDPYHELHQAQGLSFSVAPGIKIPPSLRNIYQELSTDLGIQPVEHGNLTTWGQQGVLLLNSVLTVREGQSNSHRHHGWEEITDAAIKALSDKPQPVVFILWGKPAQMKQKLIDESQNLVITSPHPSPLSAYRGFFGSKPFSQTNAYLIAHGQQPIDWHLPA
ncbi:uracil-DNA glycosylase [Periweissella fabalis]|uniref:Uracil-DNA glycosylase n=1 Tax=Periweissella fabalis TaxID=1070421 RepID=A0A7X6N2B9_9LACO|nr:uracil-DNA glycosylase [Periweissella fabalis]MCM0598904.1 uracil-DNA glycosylase [Periweissella fabalis]NKZ24566.1 uracil-DNA glycosylase [Periweissella fabalis]